MVGAHAAEKGAPEISRRPPVTVDVMRGALLESRHVVYGVLLQGKEAEPEAVLEGRVGVAWGDASLLTVSRSVLKPWQALPLVVDGAAEAFSLGEEELALAAGSHAGQDEHLRVLERFMEKTGVRESELSCPGHAPFDPAAARRWGADWGRRHDNCSGKHVGMLAWCRHQGLDATGYTSPDHPVQMRIRELLGRAAGLDPGSVGVAIDGCRAPTWVLPLAGLARLFLLLGAPDMLRESGDAKDWAEAEAVTAGLERVVQAMAAQPLLVAGRGRVDTDVIQATGGRVVSKAGAEGVWCGVDRAKRAAFAFKTIDGGFRAVVPAALAVLARRGVLSEEEMGVLSHHAHPVVRDRAGDKVGRITVHPPEETE